METNGQRAIEFVCTANHGRSPVAELIAQNYIQDNGILGYRAISSGSRVDEIGLIKSGKKEISGNEAVWSVKKGLVRGLFGNDNDYLNRLIYLGFDALPDEQKRVIIEKANDALGIFTQEEAYHRQEAVKRFGLRGNLKREGEQTITRPDTALVLGMAVENADLVKKIYEGYRHVPIVNTLKGYATGETGAEFPNSFGSGSLDAYLTMVEEIRGYVHKSLDNLMQVHK